MKHNPKNFWRKHAKFRPKTRNSWRVFANNLVKNNDITSILKEFVQRLVTNKFLYRVLTLQLLTAFRSIPATSLANNRHGLKAFTQYYLGDKKHKSIEENLSKNRVLQLDLSPRSTWQLVCQNSGKISIQLTNKLRDFGQNRMGKMFHA